MQNIWWKQEQGCGNGVFGNVAKAHRDGADAHKGLWNLRLLSKKYVNSKRLNKEHAGLLLNVSTGKADVLRAAFASVFLTCVLGGKVQASEELPAMDEDQDRDSFENLTCTNLRPAGLCLRVLGTAG